VLYLIDFDQLVDLLDDHCYKDLKRALFPVEADDGLEGQRSFRKSNLIRRIHLNKGFRWEVRLIFVYLPSREVPFRRFNRPRTTSQQRESLGKCDWERGSAVFASSFSKIGSTI
jgi:hypothetical protein